MKETYLVHLLRHHCQTSSNRVLFQTTQDNQQLTFADLDQSARAIAAYLQSRGNAGDRVALFFAPGFAFIKAFMGCLYAGHVAVPLYPPRSKRRAEQSLNLLADSGASLALCNDEGHEALSQILAKTDVELVALRDADSYDAEQWQEPMLMASDLAFLQYTSGSTGTPKGVMVSHGNLMANQRAIGAAFDTSPEDVCVSWLPQYHDMGLIGTILHPIFAGFKSVLMTPTDFIRDPMLWLEALSAHKGTLGGGPNFGYELLLDRADATRMAALDLSHWRVAFNGAEPVRAETLTRFAAHFADQGFAAEAFFPCYGMAEATLFVLGGNPSEKPKAETFCAAALKEHRADASGNDLALVASGGPAQNHTVRVVDPETRAVLSDGRIGEIWVSGPSIAQGYWNREALSKEIFAAHLHDGDGPFLRTGDLGFTHDGAYYISGRLKDLIIVRGRNHYPTDIEATVMTLVAEVDTNGVAAFSVDHAGLEELVIVAEIRRSLLRKLDSDAVIAAIRGAVSTQHEVNAFAVALVKPGSIARTTSGKIRRFMTRQQFLDGQLAEVAHDRHDHAHDIIIPDSNDTSTAGRLKSLWCQVLKTPSAEVTDNFFEQGGDSVKAIELLARIEDTFSIKLDTEALFSQPSLAQIGASLEAALLESAGSNTELQSLKLKQAPLSFAQNRLWFFHRMTPDSSMFNIPAVLALTGALDVDAMARALSQVVERQQILKQRLAVIDGVVYQQLNNAQLPELAFHDLTDNGQSEDALLTSILNSPFDLENEALVRMALIRKGEHDHLLAVCMHHIISDGWSMGILVRELSTTYRACLEGTAAALPQLPLQYSDYATWQRETQDQTADALAYWKEAMAGAPEVLELPYDRPRPQRQTFVGRKLAKPMPSDLVLGLKKLAQNHQATFFMTLQAGFSTVLARLSGQQDIILGTDVAGRNQRGISDLIGFFVNQLVLRTNLEDEPSVSTLLNRIREHNIQRLKYQDMPFEKLVEALSPERNLQYSAIFQVKLLLLYAPLDGLDLPGLDYELREAETTHAQYDLTLSVDHSEASGYVANMHYNTDLFDGATIARFTDYWFTALSAMVADPEQSVQQIDLLAADERQRLLIHYNKSEVDHGPFQGIHQYVEQAAARTPKKEAVFFEDQMLSYEVVNQRANQMARHLQAMGVTTNSLVPLFLPRGLEMVVATLAVLKAGGTFIPLDPSYPEERINTMLDVTMPTVLVTTEALEDSIPVFYGLVIVMDEEMSLLDAEDDTNLDLPIGPEQLAYLLFTSGSTGTPKAAQVPVSALANLCLWYRDFCPINETSHVLQVIPFSFDASIKNLLAPLMFGARLVLMDNGAYDPKRLLHTIERHEISLINCVPSVIYPVIELAAADDYVGLASMRCLALGAEAPAINRLRPWLLSENANCVLANIYGPTECTDISVAYRVDQSELEAMRVVPIGGPIDNVRAYVVDAHLNLVPTGAAGELLITGACLSQGYFQEAEQTAERFPQLPEGHAFGERVYRTGDLVRWNQDGALIFLGRMDHQVKLRGLRIELGEVEANLRQLQGIGDAIVMLHEEDGHKKLIAFLTSPVENPLSPTQVRNQLLEKLPDFMVPASFQYLPAFPKLPNDKVDRKKLAQLYNGDGSQERTYEAPVGELEIKLAQIWESALNQEKVGRHDNFFELGGDSLLSVRVVSEAEKLGLALTVDDIFRHQSVHLQATYLEGLSDAAGTDLTSRSETLPALEAFDLVQEADFIKLPQGLDDAYPLGQLQAGMIFHSELERGTAIYHDVFSFLLQCDWNEEAFRRAAQALIDRHPVLRTRFDMHNFSEPLQFVDTHQTVTVLVGDYRQTDMIGDTHQSADQGDASEQAARLAGYIEGLKHEPLSLQNGPLIRFHVLRMSDATFRLLIDAHHAILDGWSMATMVTQLLKGYLSELKGESLTLPETRAGQDCFVAAELKALASGEERDYWLTRLEGMAYTPLEGNATAHQPQRDSLELTLEPQLNSAVQALARRENLSVKTLLMAAHLRMLSVYLGTSDVITGTVGHGRFQVEGGDGALGLFLNTMPFRQSFNGGSWRELFEAVATAEQADFKHRRYPAVALERDMGHALFNTCFAFTAFHVYEALRGETDLQVLDVAVEEFNNFAYYGNWNMNLHGELRLMLGFDATMIDANKARACMLASFEALRHMTVNPDGLYQHQSLLSTEARADLLSAWGQGRDMPSPSFLASWQAMVSRRADAVVCTYGHPQTQSFTYQEIDDAANHLASQLLEHGAGQETIIPIYCDRGPKLLYSVIAILKCGATFLPLDPNNPINRTVTILETCIPTLILADEANQSHLMEALFQLEAMPILLPMEVAANTGPVIPLPVILPQQRAYVIFTSGSTGKPKGAMLTHDGMNNHLAAKVECLGITENDVLAQTATQSFDIVVWQLLLAPMIGARVHIIGPETVSHPDALAEEVAAQGVTIMQLVPSMLHVFCEAIEGNPALALPKLRAMATTGEALPPELCQRWLTRLPQAHLLNAYAPTECSDGVSHFVVDTPLPESSHSTPIGHTIRGTRVYILDSFGEPVPVGVPGHLHVGGLGVTRGYFADPQRTSPVLVPDHLSGISGARLYKTGDRARFMPDGRLEYLGRFDFQMKLRGFRIEPGDIEKALLHLPGVHQAVAVIIRDETERLLAYLEPFADAEFEHAGALRDILVHELPPYMIPDQFAIIQNIPTTTTGKLNRGLLSKALHPEARLLSNGGSRLPAAGMEQDLAKIWQDLLGIDVVHADDPFFQIGGHSLLATRLSTRIENELGRSLSLRQIFETPVLSDLARILEEADAAKPIDIPKLERQEAGPSRFSASLAQKRMYFLHAYHQGSSAYHIPLYLQLKGDLRVAYLEQALAIMIARHESLRTTFEIEGDDLVQVIAPVREDFQLDPIDLQETNQSLEALMDKHTHAPFDMAHDPLLRLALVRRDAQDYVLLLNFHHIIADGWSARIFHDELHAIYSALVRGEQTQLAPPSLQYADYSVWHNQMQASDDQRQSLQFWKEALDDAPPLLELPTRCARSKATSMRPGTFNLELGEELSLALESLGDKHEATAFMVFQSLFALLLGRHAGQQDVVLGTAVANREQQAVHKLIGFFINTLALRTTYADNPRFADLLKRVVQNTRAAFQHQSLPFERLVEEIAPGHNAEHTPLFQVMLVFQDPDLQLADLPGVSLSILEAHTNPDLQYDLYITLTRQDQSYHVQVHYHRDLFDATYIADMFQRFLPLAEAAITKPETLVGSLPLLSDTQRKALLATLGQGDLRPNPAFLESWTAQVARKPDAIACSFGQPETRNLTFREIDAAANHLASQLLKHGAASEMLIPIFCDRSPKLLYTVIAVLKCGATFLPLDPNNPINRTLAILETCTPSLILADQANQSHLMEVLVQLEAMPTLLSIEVEADAGPVMPLPEILPQQRAYVIFTSGSTGKPKGAMLTHDGMNNHLAAKVECLGITENDVLAQTATQSFDIVVWQLLLAPMIGARVHIIGPETVGNGVALAEEVAAQGVTIMQLVPSMLHVFCESLERNPALALPKLRAMATTGEALPPELCQRWLTRLPQAHLLNAYAPTECSDGVSHFVVDKPLPETSHTTPIGHTIRGTRVYILDSFGEPVPMGVPGHLHVGGLGVTRGYFEDPQRTSPVLVPDHLSGISGARLYKTGDRARFMPDGRMEYLGRFDFQMKLRGFRIEPGDIEKALLHIPGVHQAVAVILKAQTPRLLAYLEPHTGVELPPVSHIRKLLGQQLPAYMIPEQFAAIKSLPKTVTGKLNRGLLSKALYAEAHLLESEGSREPASGIETELATLWQELLEVSPVYADDAFFLIGGHSLLATRLAARIEARFGVHIPLATIFAHPTLEDQAKHILDHIANPSKAEKAMPALPREADGSGRFKASLAQRRMYFLHAYHDRSSAYHIPIHLELEGALQIEALATTLGTIMARHESLRTTFEMVGDTLYQVIAPPAALSLPIIELAKTGQTRHTILAAENETPFDLEVGPLIRANLIVEGPERYLLVLNVHHIVFDGWSARILAEEIHAIYTALVTGEAHSLPALPRQYADFTAWQNDREDTNDDLRFWQEALADAPPVLNLPTHKSRAQATNRRPGLFHFELEEATAHGLQAFAQSHNATPFMVLQGLFAVLLGRHADQRDVVLGTVVANRDQEVISQLLGFFVNTLALRTNFTDNPSFQELTQRVAAHTRLAFEHLNLPFEKLVEALPLQQEVDHSPVFQAMLVFQDPDLIIPDLPGVRVRLLEDAVVPDLKFDLTMTLTERDGTYKAVIQYHQDLFEADYISDLFGRFQELTRAALAQPELAVCDLPMVAQDRLDAQLKSWSAQADVAAGQPLHLRVAAMAQARPDAVALIHPEQGTLSYAELDAQANGLAALLLAQGLRAEELVGVYAERSNRLVVTLLAILKAGGAYLPMDVAYPGERVAYMAQDAGMRFIFCDAARTAIVAEVTPQLSILDIEGEIEARREALAVGVSPAQLAYAIYTSGSTGQPKGVMISHAHVGRLFAATQDDFGFSAEDCWSFFHSHAFDFSVWEIWGALCHGARLLVVPYLTSRDPHAFHALLLSHGVTILNQTPTAFRQLMQVTLQEREALALRLVIFGGEALEPASLKAFFEDHGEGRPRLINMYGITETCVHVTCREITVADTAQAGSPIGKPLADLGMFVCDEDLRPLPSQVPGAVFVSGAGVARGYLARPALTATRFLPDPFASQPGSRLYRTGDRARIDHHDECTFLGRDDTQVQLRGLRIETGEIAQACVGYTQIREAVVMVRKGRGGEDELGAWLLADSDLDLDALRQHLAAKLPAYMLPSNFFVLEQWPLTANGKLDRQRLLQLEPAQGSHRVQALPPGIATMLADIWMELLEVQAVGPDDSFFELGGHSLLATSLVTRIRERFDVDISVRNVFENAGVMDMAALIERARGVEHIAATPIIPVEHSGVLPLTFAQQRIWFLQRFEADGAAYNIPAALRLKGVLDVDALSRSLDAIRTRHEGLRTAYPEINGLPHPVINAPYEEALTAEIIGHSQLKTVLDEEASQEIALSERSLMRCRLFKLAEEEHVFAITFNHLIADGWSVSLFIDEIRSLYQAFSAGKANPLEPLPVQMTDVAHWQKTWLHSEQAQTQMNYWRNQLQELPNLTLPHDRPRPAQPTHAGSTYAFKLDATLSQHLQNFSREQGASLFMTLMAAFQWTLGRYAGASDFGVGTAIANRTQAATEDLIGLFMNALVLRAQLNDKNSFKELLALVRRQALDAYAHQDVPFEQLAEELQPERNLSVPLWFQVMMIFQNTPKHRLQLPGLELELMEAQAQLSKLDMTFYLWEGDSGLEGYLEYSTELFDEATIARFCNHFTQVLGQASHAADLPMARHSMQSHGEHAALLEVACEKVDFGTYQSIHTRVEAFALSQGDALAVVQPDGESLTYSQLNRRSNQLAARLLEGGLQPEQCVGIYLNRTVQMVVAVLAVSKAGGTFVAMDPAYPEARLAHIWRDSGAHLLIADPHLEANFTGATLISTRTDAEDPGNPDLPANPTQLAYVLYSSGSTGTPKGIGVSHGAWMNAYLAWERDYALSAGDVHLQMASFSFDVCAGDLIRALGSGAQTVLCPREKLLQPAALLELLQTYAISFAEFVPAVINALVAYLKEKDLRMPAMRLLAVGSDQWHMGQFEDLETCLQSGTRLVNSYGVTEAAIDSTYYERDALAPSGKRGVPIGRAFANTSVYVLDEDQTLTPLGLTGVLYLGGPNLARGYFKDPVRTALKFVPNPFSTEPGARLYRTDDKARYFVAANGQPGPLDFLGRADDQVKLRGLRIELGEVESAIAQLGHASVAATVKGEGNAARLVAYIASQEQAAIDQSELRQQLRRKLPDYMVPAAIVILDALPLTPNGKLDRNKLPEPDLSQQAREIVHPRSALEETMLLIWRHVLDLDMISVTDNFFEIGGHSLLATQVTSRLEQELDISVPVRLMFEEPTIANLAERLDLSLWVAGEAEDDDFEEGGLEDFEEHGLDDGDFEEEGVL